MNKIYLSILALDVGSKYIGMAICPKGSFLASPLGSFTRSTILNDVERIVNLTRTHDVDVILVGMPYSLEQKAETKSTAVVKDLLPYLEDQLEKSSSKTHVELVDERLSTWASKKNLKRLKLKRHGPSINLDSAVAVQFIEDYLEKE